MEVFEEYIYLEVIYDITICVHIRLARSPV